MAYTQTNRLISVNTPLGKDTLLLQGFTGHEGVSQLFSFSLDLLSEDSSISFDKIVGQRVTISVSLPDDKERHFDGFVSRFAQTGNDKGFYHYRAEMVPWLWFLTRTADCRIFQNKTIPDIIMQIFKDLGFTDFKMQLQGAFQPRDYCVQYRETDFNFVSRLMEQYGIFYFFEHEQGKHTLVLANSASAHKPCPNQSKVRYDMTEGGPEEEDAVNRFQVEQELRPGKYALTDYNFQTPNTSLTAKVESTVKVGGNSKYEIYDYPGEYLKKAEGEELAKIRMEQEEAVHYVGRGSSTCRSFTTGYRFDLKEHYRQDLNTTYVLTEVQHVGSSGSYSSDGGSDAGAGYSNHFTCIPHKVPFRPSRVTPKPIVQGVQTAVVVGVKGEEIYTDKYSQVKVQFHWDREGKKDENSSCWVRVAQNWAGKRWGAIFIPRIGQEVIVSFIEGDPDQPIITGRVYNAEQMPPYELPAEQTKSTIKSVSSKGAEGFNELRFEDKKGKEQIFIHAERNMDLRVKNDSIERVIGNRHLIVGFEKDGKKGGDQRELVQQDKHLSVKRNQIEHIDGNMQLLVGKGEDSDGGNQDIVIGKKKSELVEGDNDFHVKGERKEKIDGSTSLTVGMDQQEKVGKNHALDAGQEIHLKAGMKVILEAGMQLTIKAAGGFVDIGPSGVTIQGTMVMINSGGAAGSGSGSSPKEPEDPKEAKPIRPDIADDAKSGQKSAPN